MFAEIKKVRVALFQFAFTSNDQMMLPEPVGAVATLAEKVFVPAKDYPEVGTSTGCTMNFCSTTLSAASSARAA